MYKNSLNIGTLAGIMAFTLFLLLYYIGISPLGIARFIGMPIPIMAVIWAGLKTRNQVLGGTMTFTQAFLSGSVTVLVWCTFKGFCMYIFMVAFKQHVIEQYIQFWNDYVEFVRVFSKEDASQYIDLELLAKDATPSLLMMGDITNNIIFGSFISMVIAFIIKRAPRANS
jgi:hypothetical protein